MLSYTFIGLCAALAAVEAAVFTRWGRTSCGAGSTLVYNGMIHSVLKPFEEFKIITGVYFWSNISLKVLLFPHCPYYVGISIGACKPLVIRMLFKLCIMM